MEKLQRMVIEMRNAMGLEVSEEPRTLSPAEANLHIQMIRDEFEKEFVPAFLDQDLVEMYDAGIDVIVYVMGALSNAGFDIEPGFIEVMRGNMSKMDPETGLAIKAGPNDPSGEPEGKVLKGPNYVAPNLHPIINDMYKFGPSDDTVYRTTKTPLTYGVGGETIGECDIRMDHNGLVEISGVIFDPEFLPHIDTMSMTDLSYTVIKKVDGDESAEGQPEGTEYQQHPDIPEGWVKPEVDESLFGGNGHNTMKDGF